jgi:putative ABC transport system substrate-binding protein
VLASRPLTAAFAAQEMSMRCAAGLLSILLLLAVPNTPAAQQTGTGRVYRIGFLGISPLQPNSPTWQAFLGGMRERGWVENHNFAVEYRYSDGRNERYPALVAELVRAKVDLLVTAGTAATAAAKTATTTLPIVFVAVGDPVGSGFVASLARPGGNITGRGGLGPGMHAKMLDLLKEAVPQASRIAVFVNSTFPLHELYRTEIEPVAQTLRITLRPAEVRTPEELAGAFATLAKEKVDALLILAQPLMFRLRAEVAKLALEYRLPAMAVWNEAVEAGLLMSYGSRTTDDLRRVGYYVDRVLKGVKPADLPVEQSSTFYLAVHRGTAKVLGITLPPSILLQATQIVE